MENIRPMSDEELITIDGVGKVKLEKYGDAFIKAIIDFQKNKSLNSRKESTTYKETLVLFQSGLTPEEIALKRKLGLGTVMSHFAKLYLEGQAVDLHQFVSKEEVQRVKEAKTKLRSPDTLKPYYDYLEETIAYDKIRMALAIIEKTSLLN